MVKKKQKLLEKRKLDSEKLRQYALNQLKKREREEKKIEKAEEEVKDFLEEYDSNLNELLEGKTVEVKTPWEISFLRRKLTELGYYTYSMDNPETGDRELEVATETGEKPGDIETVKVAEFRLSVDYLLDRMEELKARINSGYYGKWPSIERLEGKISEGSLVPAKDLIEALENYLYHRHNLDILERKVKDSIFLEGRGFARGVLPKEQIGGGKTRSA